MADATENGISGAVNEALPDQTDVQMTAADEVDDIEALNTTAQQFVEHTVKEAENRSNSRYNHLEAELHTAKQDLKAVQQDVTVVKELLLKAFPALNPAAAAQAEGNTTSSGPSSDAPVHDPVAEPAVNADNAEATDVTTGSDWSSPVKLTIHPPKPFKGHHDECEYFLRKMKQYLKLCKVPPHVQADLAATFLEDGPDKLWATECAVRLTTGSYATWQHFESFIERNFGKIAPMTEYFKEFETLRQKSTVADYVSKLRTCVNRLKGTFLEQNDGAVTVKFLRGLKPNIAKLCEDNAPEGWWKSSDDVIAKALTFETNKAAMIGHEDVASVGKADIMKRKSDNGNGGGGHDKKAAKKPKLPNPDKTVRIPEAEFKRRQQAKPSRCVMCGELKTPQHAKPCLNKVATPFVE